MTRRRLQPGNRRKEFGVLSGGVRVARADRRNVPATFDELQIWDDSRIS